MQFGHLGIALAIASLDPRPETFAVVTAAQFLPNADSLVIRAGWARPEFHGTWSHSLAFCVAVGAAAAPLAEAVNYRLVDWAAELPKLAALRAGKAARWSVAAFLRAPFWTTVLVIFSPIPDSAVRVLAPLGKYPLPRYLGAVALGRYPRLLLVASSGALLRIPLPLLVLASVGIVLAGLGWRRLQRAGLTEP